MPDALDKRSQLPKIETRLLAVTLNLNIISKRFVLLALQKHITIYLAVVC